MATDCFGEIRKLWSKEEVPDQVILNFVNDIDKIKEHLAKQGKLNEFTPRVKEYLQSLEKLTLEQRRERALNIMKKKSLLTKFAEFNNKAEGMLSALGGSNVLIKDARYSAEAVAKSIKADLYNMLSIGLEREGLLQIAQSGNIDREISEAIFALNPNYKPTIPISEEAWKIAKVYHSINKEILNHKRSAGSNVGEILGYAKQSHDSHEIAKAGFEAWASKLIQHIDLDKSFGGIDPRSEEGILQLKGMYDRIVEGKYGFIENAPVADDLVTVFKTSRLGDKLARERSIFFKSGADFHDYNMQFGKRSLYQTMFHEIDLSSRQVGLMQVFGTDPEKTIEALGKQLKLSDADMKRVKDTLTVVQGLSNMGGDSIKAKIGAGLRAWQSITKLGFATLSSMGDWATSAAILRTNFGTNYMSGMANLAKTYFESLPKETRNLWAHRTGIFMEDLAAQLHANHDMAGTIPGAMAKMQRLMFKLNLLELHTSAAKVATARQFAMELFDHASKGWGDLNSRIRANLEIFGIDQTDWSFIKTYGVEDIHGEKAITPEALRENIVDKSIVKQIIDEKYKNQKYKPSADEYLRDLQIKLRSYFNDNVDLAVPTPGARTKSFILRGTSQDDYVGQMLRFVGQFKSFPLAVNDIFQRIALANPDTRVQSMWEATKGMKGDIQGMVGFILASTMLGYTASQLKKFAKGDLTLDDPTDLKTIQKALVQGGGLGLYGDFMFGEYNNTFNSPASLKFIKNAAGPVASEGIDMYQLYQDIKQNITDKGEISKGTKKNLVRMLQRNIPGNNLFYTKYVLDKYIFDQMNEAADPGYKIRKESRIAKKNAKEWIFKGP